MAQFKKMALDPSQRQRRPGHHFPLAEGQHRANSGRFGTGGGAMNSAPGISGMSTPNHGLSVALFQRLQRRRSLQEGSRRHTLLNTSQQTTPNLSGWKGLRSTMIVVGISLLSEYAQAHPRSAANLRAVNALLQGADWQTPEDLSTACGALLEASEGGRFVLTLHESHCQVELQVNFAIGIVRVFNVTSLSKGRTK